ncbi:Putative DNA-binding domain-containing protein [Amycolatopsis pretoriensis]|uniref:Putative DNA-binding domain-containing protein n=1 Tax=Amycolatopsis pretoriensis TaxID=218821 RepID=A0A1H5RJ76_9PSEU|nr:Putative DNA-binding domain-containing protein [Amycolatopsis pretoriensis]
MREHHWIDVKLEVGGSEGAKKEFARDVASFANDGGLLVIGVAEDKANRAFSMASVPLVGLPEQVDQILRSRCDPPLFVQCHPIEDPANPGSGVLLVEVPPSPLAPHMVDGRYHGRGDTTKHALSDAEVVRLFERRSARQVVTRALIDVEIARDPVPPDRGIEARLYAAVRATAAPPELLTEHLMGHEIDRLVRARAEGPGWKYWRLLSEDEPRAAGRGWHTYGLNSRELWLDHDKVRTAADLEVSDNGSLALFVSRLSFEKRVGDGKQKFLHDGDAVAVVRGLAELVGSLGTTYGYQGQWQLAVGMTPLAKVVSADVGVAWVDSPEDVLRYSAEDFVSGTTATTAECREQPGAVTRRLMYRLVRALGTADRRVELFA